ncbi:S8 family peptidase [bacterium SCSIO 12741]|nr:S8 family peptidase [bacterium SCSIO 12741]
MRRINLPLLTLSLFFVCPSFAHSDNGPVTTVDSLNTEWLNWFNRDPLDGKIQGASVYRAYSELLTDKKPKKKIVVAIIDSGVDTAHQDLQGKFWTNQDEIPGNGKDDDNNGYIDDIHGWNYLGNTNGENINEENLEYTRLVRELGARFDDLEAQEMKVYQECKDRLEKELKEYEEMHKNITSFKTNFENTDEIMRNYFGNDRYTKRDVESISPGTSNMARAKAFRLYCFEKNLTLTELDDVLDHYSVYLDYYLNVDWNARKVVGDDPNDLEDRKYGNNDVTGPRSDHGTSVAGVVAAVRNNGVGIDGIAESVEIMVLRTVPKGDEYDKDVALAIRYAVDNGAQVINMSFGKDYSPNRSFVDEAIRYAEENNVLLVHAAGNNGENIDKNNHYPVNHYLDGSPAKTLITVGASSSKAKKNLPGSFSNYGTEQVDLFAPGVNIVSLAPNNRYDVSDGTSLASPVVAGVAALVWSYYPDLTAVQLKEILLRSVRSESKRKVICPTEESDKKSKVRFAELSRTGGLVDAYQALIMAEEYMAQ